jgi:hypothetical protein
MIDQPLSLPNDIDALDWDVLNSAEIDLSSTQIERAATVSRGIRVSEQRWQVYLTALGVLGFEQWIHERAPELSVDIEHCSIWQPSANVISAGCQVRVGSFKVCVVSVGSVMGDRVSVPIAAFEAPDFAAHFYVLTQVFEEEETLAVSGFLSYDQYRRVQGSLAVEQDWNYSLPLEAFNIDTDALLLNLRCLAPDAIRLPDLVFRSIARLQANSIELRSQLQSQAVWNVLSVDEGLTLLSDPDLINSLYQTTSEGEAEPQPVDAGLWWREQLDRVAQDLGWMLMPISVMRSTRGRSMRGGFDAIRSGLENQGIQIPDTAGGAYQTLRTEQGSFRVYAITWRLPEATDQPEWQLLVALGAEPETDMPRSLRLEIRDEGQTLVDQSSDDTRKEIVYGEAVAQWNEQLWITVTANHTTTFEIPPLKFEIDEFSP